jgi:hypothetical protein
VPVEPLVSDEDDDALIPMPDIELESSDLDTDLLIEDPDAAGPDAILADSETTQPEIEVLQAEAQPEPVLEPEPDLSAAEGVIDLDNEMELATVDTSDLDVAVEPFDESDSLFDKSGAELSETDPEA